MDSNAKKFIEELEQSNKFNDYQMGEIQEGFENGLSIDQVQVYAKPEFDDNQMEQIRWGFRNGLTMEQVKVYADPKFDDWAQMHNIREGFEDGLTIEQVQMYAKPEFNWTQMYKIREGFENDLFKEQVNSYVNDGKSDKKPLKEHLKDAQDRIDSQNEQISAFYKKISLPAKAHIDDTWMQQLFYSSDWKGISRIDKNTTSKFIEGLSNLECDFGEDAIKNAYIFCNKDKERFFDLVLDSTKPVHRDVTDMMRRYCGVQQDGFNYTEYSKPLSYGKEMMDKLIAKNDDELCDSNGNKRMFDATEIYCALRQRAFFETISGPNDRYSEFYDKVSMWDIPNNIDTDAFYIRMGLKDIPDEFLESVYTLSNGDVDKALELIDDYVPSEEEEGPSGFAFVKDLDIGPDVPDSPAGKQQKLKENDKDDDALYLTKEQRAREIFKDLTGPEDEDKEYEDDEPEFSI